ncbi:protein phosphatase 2C domain-containing protein [Sorangium sp. So ce429]
MMPPTESSLHLKIEFAQASDAGRDPNKQVNEDACGYAETKFGHLCVLCDGMGGHYGGSEASRTAITTIFEVIEQTPATVDPRAALKAAIEEAGRRVYQLGGPADNRVRPGSTVVAMILHDAGVDIAHVGDSRAYVIRSQQIYPLTRDHSMVQGMVDAGMITEAQAVGHPDANKITRALGMKPEVEVEVRPEPMELYPGDVLIQSSDGLTDLVLSGDILGCTRQALASGSVEHACRMLVQLANYRGGHDNITVQMARVLETGSRSLTIAHGPPGAGSADADEPRASNPQETVAMTRPEEASSGQQSPADSPPTSSAPALRPAPASSATTVVPTGADSAPALRPAPASSTTTVVPTGVDRTLAAAASSAPLQRPTVTDGAPAVVQTVTDSLAGVVQTVTDNLPPVAPVAASSTPLPRPMTIDSDSAVVPTVTDNLPPVAPPAAIGAPPLRPTAIDSAPAVSPTAMDTASAVPPTVPPVPRLSAPDAPAVLSPLPLSAPAPAPPPGAPPHPGSFGAPPPPGAAYGVPPHPGPFGAPPPPGAPFGASPHAGAPYGAPPHAGAPYGAPPHAGAPYGAPPHAGAPYGAPPHPGSFGAPPPPGAAFGPPPHPLAQDAPPASVAFAEHRAAAPGSALAGAPHHHLAPAPPHAHGYAAAAPGFSGPMSSPAASSVPTTVRTPRGVYIAAITAASAVIVVLLAVLLWKLAGD